MKPSTKVELERTTRLAEALYRVEIEHGIDDPMFQHHINNSVMAMRGVDLSEDTDEEIETLCKQTQERLEPFLHFLKLLK